MSTLKIATPRSSRISPHQYFKSLTHILEHAKIYQIDPRFFWLLKTPEEYHSLEEQLEAVDRLGTMREYSALEADNALTYLEALANYRINVLEGEPEFDDTEETMVYHDKYQVVFSNTSHPLKHSLEFTFKTITHPEGVEETKEVVRGIVRRLPPYKQIQKAIAKLRGEEYKEPKKHSLDELKKMFEQELTPKQVI